jgi:hypothetical protein
VLSVGPEARWFRLGDGAVVDLGRRQALRLLLAALIDRHQQTPGASIDGPALLAAGWPGERVLPSAGSTRVRVAISTLRRLGLASAIVTDEDGYRLDPGLVVSPAVRG